MLKSHQQVWREWEKQQIRAEGAEGHDQEKEKVGKSKEGSQGQSFRASSAGAETC